jgi:glycerol-3-phosphate acyltransferase PlsX
MPTIAIDAMGGDRAPAETVWGAVEAGDSGVDVVLVGDETLIAPVLREADADIPIVPASQVVEMDDDPARAIREKKDSSIAVAARLVAAGDAAGLVSAGSTGATMAAAAFIVGRLPGISRPAVSSVYPTGKTLIDAGANLECRPAHLVQFAVMGRAVSQVYSGIDDPRVGLLNIGEEDSKGRSLERETFALLSKTPGINFVGNVEGRELGLDTADVIVTDGFTGNVLLKTSEGVGRAIYHLVLEALADDRYQEAIQALMPAFLELRRTLDAETVGGAHLVGTKGVVVIGHGSSSRVAVANAAVMAAEGVNKGLVDRIATGVVDSTP